MKRYIQHDYLKISHFVASEWQHPVHNHNHFELIFVHRGNGTHCIGGLHFPYTDRSLFLLAPDDTHHFSIKKKSVFTFIKFTNIYLKGFEPVPRSNWNQQIDLLMQLSAQKISPFVTDDSQKKKFDSLFHLIAMEWNEKKRSNDETLFYMIQALLSKIKDGAAGVAAQKLSSYPDKIVRIVNHIHEHIYDTEKVQVGYLADLFSYSKTYLGEYFREQMGVSLRDYIAGYKTHLIESRLRFGSMSFKEIADEFGFVDASHLSRFFRKQRGMTPTAYRSLGNRRPPAADKVDV